jgi:hypothetical protein
MLTPLAEVIGVERRKVGADVTVQNSEFRVMANRDYFLPDDNPLTLHSGFYALLEHIWDQWDPEDLPREIIEKKLGTCSVMRRSLARYALEHGIK